MTRRGCHTQGWPRVPAAEVAGNEPERIKGKGKAPTPVRGSVGPWSLAAKTVPSDPSLSPHLRR
jgi:hypothetical protein